MRGVEFIEFNGNIKKSHIFNCAVIYSESRDSSGGSSAQIQTSTAYFCTAPDGAAVEAIFIRALPEQQTQLPIQYTEELTLHSQSSTYSAFARE